MRDKLISKEDDHYGSLDAAQPPAEDRCAPGSSRPPRTLVLAVSERWPGSHGSLRTSHESPLLSFQSDSNHLRPRGCRFGAQCAKRAALPQRHLLRVRRGDRPAAFS